MPDVRVNLYAAFRKLAEGKPSIEVQIEPGQTIETLLRQLDIPLEEIRILFCDHRLVDRSHTLQGGETIGVFPAVGGG